MNNILVVKSGAILDYGNLDKVINEIKDNVSRYDLDNPIVQSQEDIKALKGIRANINKQVKAVSDERIRVKKAINESYDKLDLYIKDNLLSYTKDQIEKLDKVINDYEDKQKLEIENELRAYFDEVNIHKFFTFEHLNIKVLLSTSVKNEKENIDKRIDQITADLFLINQQDESIRARIITHYEQSLNVSLAIFEVNEQVTRENELQQRVVAETPVEVKIVQEVEEIEFYHMKLQCTPTQFSKLQVYLKENGIEFRHSKELSY